MRHSSSKRLAQLKQKHEQLKAQIHTLEAAEQSRQRKQETRRKILIGAYYLNQAFKRHVAVGGRCAPKVNTLAYSGLI